MASFFDERKALHMTLQGLLEQRAALRRQYVDQDKQLGLDIKELLARIRELDERENAYQTNVEAPAAEEVPTEVLEHLRKRKTPIRHDYAAVAEQVEAILREASAPLTLMELCSELKQRHGVEFASPYIGIQKALKHLPQVKVDKDGRKLIFSLKR
ncbi:MULTISPECIES: hypothetical protein [Bacillales]|jgi:hypothetical protein|uniref:HARE-HTH domain-containing protein n=1 Tax=Brevibacillus aydinogluensis TaxID=927786 RepID=A0AA48MCJ3_9BACL|nr:MULTISPECIES: hypothetical protein [Bacillales]REK61990.1 MAG: hypothetical protein DF221_14300 [Brevibacillus sp.]MBR8661591.1 hypothetical protein [Brevibacillus sp. NL20B1]MDT3417945.1 hypothetical protein [Brevibacillus aydinogluensis]NNV03667.1 hypothetical protein [Brevibacillus sp. MCWH]UFJ62957.1 hypothetical protein IRT44_09630 [Anoxybacillus sediminis]